MDINKLFIDIICFLGIDVINKVNSGYFGIVIGVVLMVYILFIKYINIYLKMSCWINCDCFIFFVGYGFMLFYVFNYLFGYKVFIEDLKNFRNYFGNILGYLEYGYIDGVEIIFGLFG